MTGLSLRLWHDGKFAPVEGGGALAERGRAPVRRLDFALVAVATCAVKVRGVGLPVIVV